MPVQTPTSWFMGAAQLVTPTTSQLSVINAIQVAVTACPDWTVNATGLTSLNYKWVEVKPANAQSVYANYRILFVERVNNAVGKVSYGGVNGATIFNSTSYVVALFAPDGGACTFTPSNIEVSSAEVYVGTKFKSTAAVGGSTVWAGIGLACTALWLYTCDGAMWVTSRQTATSHSLTALGNVLYTSGSTDIAYNSVGTEVGVPSLYLRNGLSAATAISQLLAATSSNSVAYYWKYTSAVNPYYTPAIATPTSMTQQFTGLTLTAFYGAGSDGASFLPIGAMPAVGSPPWIFRGVYAVGNMKTRTTLQTGSPAATVGFTWFPDDTASTGTIPTLAFMNT